MQGQPPKLNSSLSKAKLQSLPTSLGSFPKLRTAGHIYIDKTHIISQLLMENALKAVFLSRPRRFGKTLLLSTIEAILQGREDLFQGLDICRPSVGFNWKKSHVIQLNLAQSYTKKLDYEDSLTAYLIRTAKRLGISLASTNIKDAITDLIDTLHGSYGDICLMSKGERVLINGSEATADHKGVSILIDESDFPLLINCNNKEKLRSVQDSLSEFYTALKGAHDDGIVDLIMVTGITRFKELFADSGMNILKDITFSPAYSLICGFTADEIAFTLKHHLEDVFEERKSIPGEKSHSSVDDLFLELKDWYDGYSWDGGATEVLNPHSVFQFLENKTFGRYWYDTGAPSFLRMLDIQDIDYFKLYAKNTASEDVISDGDLATISAPTALLMTGYLSVSKIDKTRDIEGKVLYHLAIPNKEVKMSFAKDHLVDRLYPGATENDADKISDLYTKFGTSFSDLNVDIAAKIFSTILSKYPSYYIRSDEKFFQLELSRALRFADGNMLAEPNSIDGRPDFIFRLRSNTVLVIEVKYNKTIDYVNELKSRQITSHTDDDNNEISMSSERSANGPKDTSPNEILPHSPHDIKKQPGHKKNLKTESYDERIRKRLDVGIKEGFNQIYNRGYAREFLWQNETVYAIAVSIVDRREVKIDFKEVTDGDWRNVPRPSLQTVTIISEADKTT
ncbi:MAG: AAA family ATPase [Deltaproteobacteria bacterium]|nr:AAA family ATPase [Deltaproteobacteria bacterium]